MSQPDPPVRLRVLQVNSLLAGGGADDQCLKLTRGLVDLGQDVWLAGPEERPETGGARELGVRFLAVPCGKRARLTFIRTLARIIYERKIQIVHAHHGRDIWPAILAARLSGIRPKVLLTQHLARSPGSLASRRLLLSQVDAVIAVSEFVARVLREGVYEPESPVEERWARPPLSGDHRKIVVVHGGIDAQRFQPMDAEQQRADWGLSASHVAFGVVGRYDSPRGKGQREFLEAASRIRQHAPSARFLVVGQGDLKDALNADIRRLGLTGRAWLTPDCANLPAAMNALDCLVHPQVATDPFPTEILEAMACNRPVIATACDGAPEQFMHGEQGLIVPMEDVSALGEAMRRVATSRELRSYLCRSNREHVLKNFTVAHLASRVLEVYARIVGSPTAA